MAINSLSDSAILDAVINAIILMEGENVTLDDIKASMSPKAAETWEADTLAEIRKFMTEGISLRTAIKLSTEA